MSAHAELLRAAERREYEHGTPISPSMALGAADELDELSAEVERLRTALKRYGAHRPNCREFGTGGCHCGFVEALRQADAGSERVLPPRESAPRLVEPRDRKASAKPWDAGSALRNHMWETGSSGVYRCRVCGFISSNPHEAWLCHGERESVQSADSAKGYQGGADHG